MTLARLIEAVENGQWDHTVAWKVFGIGKTGQAERAFNGSLDAAKRLHDALLTGWHLSEMQEAADPSDYPGRHWLVVLATREEATRAVEATAADPARAFLLAILRAMEGRDG